jgi:hypothetical protein
LGGLGVSWGANCFALEDYELERIGIPAAVMPGYYTAAAGEVGISGRTDDALTPLIANLDHGVIQPPLPLDSNAETILRRYQAKEERYKASGIYLGQSLLAMLSESLGDRHANPQTDMDFWGDSGRSVYRPRYTIEKLKAFVQQAEQGYAQNATTLIIYLDAKRTYFGAGVFVIVAVPGRLPAGAAAAAAAAPGDASAAAAPAFPVEAGSISSFPGALVLVPGLDGSLDFCKTRAGGAE